MAKRRKRAKATAHGKLMKIVGGTGTVSKKVEAIRRLMKSTPVATRAGRLE
jgi:hypothetical protein